MATSGMPAFKDAPRGARLAKAFSPQTIHGEGRLFQEHRVPAGYWIDVGFEWQAMDVPTLFATWPFLKIAISVDGQAITNPQEFSKGPRELILQTPQGMRAGFAMQNAVCIPPLSLGEHTVEWTIRFERDLDDGWTAYRQGKEVVITSLIHVVALPQPRP